MKNKNKLKEYLLVAMFAALTAVGAFVRIPFGVSTFTLQLFITMLAGAVLGAKNGALSQAVYIFLGFVGLPVFATGGGLGYFLQPTCGFVLALPPVAFVIGAVMKPKCSFFRSVLGGALALVVLYTIGLTYMGVILNLHLGKGMSIWDICMAGMIPFIPFDVAKMLAVVLTAPRLVSVLRKK